METEKCRNLYTLCSINPYINRMLKVWNPQNTDIYSNAPGKYNF
jgi:hypothetical protein